MLYFIYICASVFVYLPRAYRNWPASTTSCVLLRLFIELIGSQEFAFKLNLSPELMQAVPSEPPMQYK
jgi:hypothetical protein